MADLPIPLSQLVKSLRRLPGVGVRSAERMALRIISDRGTWPEQLSQDIVSARTGVTFCPQCGFFSTGGGLCEICSDSNRDASTICVVEGPQDVLTIERAKGYRGLYHCLGGKISPLDGVGIEDLKIPLLLERLEKGAVQEVIMALGSDVEGETTTLHLLSELKKYQVKISRLAQGISVGTGLDTHDPVTLAHALASRRPA